MSNLSRGYSYTHWRCTWKKTQMQVLLHFSILWITGSSQTTLGINLGLFYICHRGKEKEKGKMGHHNLDIVQLKKRWQVSQRDHQQVHCWRTKGLVTVALHQKLQRALENELPFLGFPSLWCTKVHPMRDGTCSVMQTSSWRQHNPQATRLAHY